MWRHPPPMSGADAESLKGASLANSGQRVFLEREQQGEYPGVEMNLELSRERRGQCGWNQWKPREGRESG